MRKLYLLIVLSILILPKLQAQISSGGQPVFLSGSKTKSSFSIPVAKLPKINNDSLLRRDLLQEDYRKGYNFAHAVHTNFNHENSGVWMKLKNENVWLLEIQSSEAHSLNLILDYHLFPGAKLYLFNKKTGKTLGAYTHKNNKDWKRLAVQPLVGETITLEYHVPTGVNKGTLGVKTVGHGYLKAYDNRLDDEYDDFGRSESCTKDINGPLGQGWQREKRSVIKIVIQRDLNTFSKSTGTLVNNTNQDQTPYVLTCEHAINGYSNDEDYTPQMGAENSIYFFNYESTIIGQDGDQTQSISGANVRATKPDLDFCLLELSTSIPEAYKPFFAGWSNSKNEFEYTTCISHPKGDVKKIAKTKGWVKADGIFNPNYPYRLNTHWDTQGWDYPGIEGGSSGSALFNNEHRLIGILSGGNLTCETKETGDESFQMLHYCWEDTQVKSQQLKNWLDPSNSGVNFLDGYDPYHENELNMYPNKDLCYLNEPITFKVDTKGNYTNYKWNFGSRAIPENASGKESVEITFIAVGKHTVTLTATNESGAEESFTLENYIEVFNRPASVDFDSNTKSVKTGEAITFNNLSSGSNTGYTWDFGEGAEPRNVTTSSMDPISITYTSTGFKDISLTAHNPLGDKSITMEDYLQVGEDIVVDFTIEDGPYFVGDPIHIESTDNKWANIGYGCYWEFNDERPSTVLVNGVHKGNYSEIAIDPVFDKAGTYKVSFTATSHYDQDSKSKTIEVRDHINSVPILTLINDYTVKCEVSNPKSDQTYEWDFDDGEFSNQEIVEHEYNGIGTYNITLTITNPYEEKKITSKWNVNSLPTAIEEITKAEFKIYPNPAVDYVKVKLPERKSEQTSISLFNLTGKKIYRQEIDSYQDEITIQANNYPPGIYIIVLQMDTDQISKKLIIK